MLKNKKMLTYTLDENLNGGLTRLSGAFVLMLDDGGAESSYSENMNVATAFQFVVPYSVHITINTENGFDYLALFKNNYGNLTFDREASTKFTTVAPEDFIVAESGKKVLDYTFGVGDTITVAFGSNGSTQLSGFRITMFPTTTFALTNVDLLLSDFPAEFFKGKRISQSKFGGEVAGYNFDGCVFQDCQFDQTVVNDSSLKATRFERCTFTNVELRKIVVDAATSMDDECVLRTVLGVDIVGTTENLPKDYKIINGHFFGPYTSHFGKVFGVIDLRGVDFTGCDFRATDLSEARLGDNMSKGILSGLGTAMSVIQAEESFFGASSSLSADGTILAVGAPRKDSSEQYTGMVRVFIFDGSWQQLGQDIVVDDNPLYSDQLGYSVSLNASGTRLAAGAVQSVGDRYGFVKVYSFDQGGWTQLGNTIEGTGVNDNTGIDVAMSLVGDRIAVGAYKDDNDTTDILENQLAEERVLLTDIAMNSIGTEEELNVPDSEDIRNRILELQQQINKLKNSGSISIYQFEDDQWVLVGNKIETDVQNGKLGRRVFFSSDGTTVLGLLATSKNEARVYREINNVWNQLGEKIVIERIAVLSGSGDIVAAAIKDEQDRNFVQAYRYDNGEWTPYGNPMSAPDYGQIGDISITADGSHVLFHEENNFDIYLYQWNGSDWSLKVGPIDSQGSNINMRNELSDTANVFVIGDFLNDSVKTFRFISTVWPTGYAIHGDFLYKTTLSPTDEIILAAAPELRDEATRDEYLRTVIEYLVPDNGKLLIPSTAFGSPFLDNGRQYTNVPNPGGTSMIFPDLEYNYYLISEEGESFTAVIPGTSGALFTKRGSDLLVEYQGQKYVLSKGDELIVGDYLQIKNGSFFIIYLRTGTICFDGSELVETDQGYIPICKIDKSVHTIGNQPIRQVSCTRCADNHMVRIQKNSFGEGIPNKDTLITLRHKISYQGRMRPAAHFVRRKGISLVESHNQVVFNVMLPTHTRMRVNNMLTETLHPDCI